MNVFALDKSPRLAAQYHNDTHVRKMIIEYAQLMSTAHRLSGSARPVMYKASHKKHPCTHWCRGRAARYRWLYALFVALCDEFIHRFDKVHLTDRELRLALLRLPKTLADDAHEQSYDVDGFVLAMPDEYKSSSAVESYRQYYINDKRSYVKQGKVIDMAVWTNREPPWWWQ